MYTIPVRPVPAAHPVSLSPLTLSAPTGRLLADDRPALASSDPTPVDTHAGGPAARDPHLASPAPSPGTVTLSAASAHRRRPSPLGLVVASPAGMASSRRHRRARDGHRLASSGLPSLLTR